MAETSSLEKPATMPTKEELSHALIQVEKKLTLGKLITHGSYAIFLILMSFLN